MSHKYQPLHQTMPLTSQSLLADLWHGYKARGMEPCSRSKEGERARQLHSALPEEKGEASAQSEA